jgi:AcrR family transcriptional regulator
MKQKPTFCSRLGGKMDKRVIENNRVKHAIEQTLLDLMQQKPFSEISISEITTTAQVARTSYYRNFTSKESIIESFVEQLHVKVGASISNAHDAKLMFTERNVVISLKLYAEYRRQLLTLYDQGFGNFIQEELNQYAEDILGDMPATSLDRYRIYFIAGGMLNTAIQWLRNGAKESPKQIANTFVQLVAQDLTRPLKNL